MFSGMQIRVGFQSKLQLTFCCTIVTVKPWFMAMSLSVAPSQKLIAKNRLCYNTHTLQVSYPVCSQMSNRVNNPQVSKTRY